MRHARFALLLGMLISVMVVGWALEAAQPADPPQGQWKVVMPKTNIGDKVRIASFHNETFGLWGGAGDVGKAHYSLDGGKSWTVADSSGG